jgi:hypothetical protein
MKALNALCVILITLLFVTCISDNIEEKYSTGDNVTPPKGEVAWFPMNGNLTDSTGNNTLLAVAGEVNFTKGFRGEALLMNGEDNYIMVSPGYLDTISVLFWLKTPKGIVNPNRPVVFDYGLGAVSASLTDGISGATVIAFNQSDTPFSTFDVDEQTYLNTYYNYSLMYIEVAGKTASYFFKGYLRDGKELAVSNSHQMPLDFDPANDLLYIGRSASKSGIANSFFNGAIDELHIFSKTLTDSEIQYFNNLQPE